MTEEREIRKETDLWGNEKEIIYEDNRKVGEIRTEERGGLFGIGAEPVKVEYDNSGQEISYSKQEERGGIFGIGADQVEVRYDNSDKEISHSRIEERGGLFGIGAHHVRVEYSNDLNEISQTNTERRGDFLGIGGERVRVTRYSKNDVNEALRGIDATKWIAGTDSSSTTRSESSGGILWVVLLCGLIAGAYHLGSQNSSEEKIIDLKHCAETRDAHCFILMALKNVESGNVDPFDRVKVYANAATLLSKAKRADEAQKYFNAARTTLNKIAPKLRSWGAHNILIDNLLLAGRRDEALILLSDFEAKVGAFSGGEKEITQQDYQLHPSIPADELSSYMLLERQSILATIASKWSLLNETSRAEHTIDSLTPSWYKVTAIENVVREEALAKRWKNSRYLADRLRSLNRPSLVNAMCEILKAAAKAGNRDLASSLALEMRHEAKNGKMDWQKLHGYKILVECLSEAELYDWILPEMIADIDALSLSPFDKYRDRNQALSAQITASLALHKLGNVKDAKDRLSKVLANEGYKAVGLASKQAKLGMYEDAIKTLKHNEGQFSFEADNVKDAMLDNPNLVSEQAITMLRNLFTEAKDQNSVDELHATLRAKKGDIKGALDIINWMEHSGLFMEIAKTILSESNNSKLQHEALDQTRDKKLNARKSKEDANIIEKKFAKFALPQQYAWNGYNGNDWVFMKAVLMAQKVPDGLKITVSEFSYKYSPETMSRKTKGHRLEIDEKSIALLSFSARKDCEGCRVFFHQDLPVGKGQFYSLPSPISIVIPTKVIDDADVITMSLHLSKYSFFFTEEIKLSANDRITH